MNILEEPDLSHKAANAVQMMPYELKERFVNALLEAKSVADLTPEYKDYLANGYKPAKVLSALEEALGDVVMEWEN